MITRVDLQRLSKREGVALGTCEKDYVLTEVLKALPEVTKLKGFPVFKGGTALRKIYFPSWRYSEDLDFTAKADRALSEIRKGLDEWYVRVAEPPISKRLLPG
jgi:predicted nucleotidyltransferase component of viral defense system